MGILGLYSQNKIKQSNLANHEKTSMPMKPKIDIYENRSPSMKYDTNSFQQQQSSSDPDLSKIGISKLGSAMEFRANGVSRHTRSNLSFSVMQSSENDGNRNAFGIPSNNSA